MGLNRRDTAVLGLIVGRYFYDERGWVPWISDCLQIIEKRECKVSNERSKCENVDEWTCGGFANVWLCRRNIW